MKGNFQVRFLGEGRALPLAPYPTESPDAVAATVATLRRKGIVVLGIYVGPQEKIAKLQAIFGTEYTIPVERLTDLPARLGRLLLKYKHGG